MDFKIFSFNDLSIKFICDNNRDQAVRQRCFNEEKKNWFKCLSITNNYANIAVSLWSLSEMRSGHLLNMQRDMNICRLTKCLYRKIRRTAVNSFVFNIYNDKYYVMSFSDASIRSCKGLTSVVKYNEHELKARKACN